MIATKTLQLINDMLMADQGARFRELSGNLIPLADDAFRGEESPFRSHLGASILGRDCAREIWYSFRWTTRPHFDGRMLRLFNRGHLEEPRMIALITMIGCEVWSVTKKGKQYRVGGHFGHAGGSLDAVIRGIPECPNEPLLGEFKTHSEKSFDKLKEQGVIRAKWEHFVQMQYYMGHMGLNGALYMAVNKNTDELHAELVAYDHTQFLRYQERAKMLIEAANPPPRISQDKTFFKCKFCDHKEVCHGNKQPEKTCRSCVSSIVRENGEWFCTEYGTILTKEEQEQACDEYHVGNFKVKP